MTTEPSRAGRGGPGQYGGLQGRGTSPLASWTPRGQSLFPSTPPTGSQILHGLTYSKYSPGVSILPHWGCVTNGTLFTTFDQDPSGLYSLKVKW